MQRNLQSSFTATFQAAGLSLVVLNTDVQEMHGFMISQDKIHIFPGQPFIVYKESISAMEIVSYNNIVDIHASSALN